MNHLISIIIPVYKVQAYISSCLKSITQQTYSNFEAILIDDGSPDESINIAKNIIRNDPRFSLLTKKNGGQGSARNMGIDHARGDYITFIDSDDYIEPTFLEDMYNQIITTDADICLCDINIVLNGKIINTFENDPDKYIKKDDFLLCLDTISSFMWDKLFKKDVFKNMRFDESIRTYEDSHFVFRLIYGRKITHVNKHLYNYIQREGSTTNSMDISYIEDKLAVINEFIAFANSKQPTKINNNEYLTYCYLKSYIYIACIGIARYSLNYFEDINKLQKNTDENYFNLKNIFKLIPKSKQVGLALLLYKISPSLFRVIVKKRDQLKKCKS